MLVAFFMGEVSQSELIELLGAPAGYATKEAAIAAALQCVDGFTDFDGNNCDDCAGWDGESRRCDCGNRRVYWETSEHKDGTFTAYAVAW